MGGSGTTGEGYDGGDITGSFYNVSAGGGGAGQAGLPGYGSNSAYRTAGDGGDGLAVAITGTSTYYAGGAGGTVPYNEMVTYGPGAGGQGGGADGVLSTGSAAGAAGLSGTANTGGGGSSKTEHWSLSNYNAGSGGSGIVILRLLTADYSGATTGSPTVTTDGDYTVIKFTSSGTYVH